MNIFIAGARTITNLDNNAKNRLLSIYEKGHNVLVGDCYGVDTSVQKIYADLNYDNVTVYASNGKARNNIGHWSVVSIPVTDNVKGFDLYKQKDIAMSNEADYGFMIWNGESKGTLNNMINLVNQNKTVLVYFVPQNRFITIENQEGLNELLGLCPADIKRKYNNLRSESLSYSQMALF